MRIDFNISKSAQKNFSTSCEAIVRNVGRGTKAATIEAIKSIMAAAQSEVPIDTGTLMESIYGGTFRRGDTKGYIYGGVIGFGSSGGFSGSFATSKGIDWLREPSDPINPKTGIRASQYATRIHEDLNMFHVNGKAKFLEDPVREYATGNFMRNNIKYWREAIEESKE